MLVAGAGAMFAVALPLTVLPSAFAGRGVQASVAAPQAHAASASVQSASLPTGGVAPVARRIASPAIDARPARACQPASGPSDYVNPLAHARVTPERIDQGVDYAGSGILTAIGTATVTHVATDGTGWPGSFIEYRLLEGPDAGCYVFYAEGVTPAAGLRVGDTVPAGQPIARIISGWETGIEIGWGAGTGTTAYAAKARQWDATSDEHSSASPAGKSFSALVASLGGPPGKIEG